MTRAAVPLLAWLLVAGCMYDPAPVTESRVVTRPVGGMAAPEFHVVQRGDTLFSIAWRHGLDYREVARLNGIAEPWVIHPDQRLRLRAVAGSTRPAVAGNPSPARPAPAPAPPPAVKPAAPPPRPAAPPAPAAPVPAGTWQWPADGRVLSRFNAAGTGPKGIALDGRVGDPVRAARAGRVVYTGSSLVGYGELVIVKHDEAFLSAYAHNSRLRVREGDPVQAGQVIAEMGSSGADRVKLHFEIRRNGDPVDPMGLLPPR